jgi:hypothetical protein
MTEALVSGTVMSLTAGTPYAVPPGPYRILANNALTYSTTVGGVYNALTGATAEPGALVSGGFIQCAAPSLVVAKRVNALDTYAALVSRSGPLAYFRLNESSGNTCYDYIGQQHLAKGSGVTLAQAGPLGDGSFAALFDGTVNAMCSTASGVNTWFGQAALSFEAWIFNAAFGASHEMIVSLGTLGMYMSVNNSNPFMSIFLAAQHTTRATTTNLAINTWHHLAATWESGDQLRLYANGVAVPVDNNTVRSGTLDNSPNYFVGVLGPNLLPFSGLIDDVAVYLRKLTAAEIMAHYSARMAK